MNSTAESPTAKSPSIDKPDLKLLENKEEQEEEEPILTYSRLHVEAEDVLELKGLAHSALSATSKLLCLGSHSGDTFILDIQGHLIRKHSFHQASVTAVHIDPINEEYWGSVGMDGRVVICDLSSSNSSSNVLVSRSNSSSNVLVSRQYGRSLRCMAICASWVVFGGMAGDLILLNLSNNKEQVIFSNPDAPIFAVSWHHHRKWIVVATEDYVHILDTFDHQQMSSSLLKIGSSSIGIGIGSSIGSSTPLTQDIFPITHRPDLYPVRFHWVNTVNNKHTIDQYHATLIIGSGNIMRVVRVHKGPSSAGGLVGGITDVLIDVEVELDAFVCGISSRQDKVFVLVAGEELATDNHDEDHIATTTTTTTTTSTSTNKPSSSRPEMRALSLDNRFEELSTDVLTITGYEKCRPCDLDLVTPSNDDVCYILSPRDLITCSLHEGDPRVEWLLERSRFEEAMVFIRANRSTTTISLQEVARQYIEHLTVEGNYEKAAREIEKLLANETEYSNKSPSLPVTYWQEWISWFAKAGELAYISRLVPVDGSIDSSTHEIILTSLIKSDASMFYKTLVSWSSKLYDYKNVLLVLEDELPPYAGFIGGREEHLLKSALFLYERASKWDKALQCLIKLGGKDLVQFIESHGVYLAALNTMIQILKEAGASAPGVEGMCKDFVRLFVNHHEELAIPTVVQALTPYPLYLHMYLSSLFNLDPSLTVQYQNQQLRLYADYEPSALLGFLKLSKHYSLDEALKLVRTRSLTREMVYILGRMDNTKSALKILVEQLADMELAIEFAKEWNDRECWSMLSDYALERPALLRGVLVHCAGYCDISNLIMRIHDEVSLADGVRESLVQAIRDVRLQVRLLQDCQAIFVNDTLELMQVYIGRNKKARRRAKSCNFCGRNFMPSDSILMFQCLHVIHASCLPSLRAQHQFLKSTMTATAATARGLADINMTAMSSEFADHTAIPILQRGTDSLVECPLCKTD